MEVKACVKVSKIFINLIAGIMIVFWLSPAIAKPQAAEIFLTTFQNFKNNFGLTSKAWLSPASP